MPACGASSDDGISNLSRQCAESDDWARSTISRIVDSDNKFPSAEVGNDASNPVAELRRLVADNVSKVMDIAMAISGPSDVQWLLSLNRTWAWVWTTFRLQIAPVKTLRMRHGSGSGSSRQRYES